MVSESVAVSGMTVAPALVSTSGAKVSVMSATDGTVTTMGIVGSNPVRVRFAVVGSTLCPTTGANATKDSPTVAGVMVTPIGIVGSKVVMTREDVVGVTVRGTTGAKTASDSPRVVGVTVTGTCGANVAVAREIVEGITTEGSWGAKVVVVSATSAGVTTTGRTGAKAVVVRVAVAGITVVPAPLPSNASSRPILECGHFRPGYVYNQICRASGAKDNGRATHYKTLVLSKDKWMYTVSHVLLKLFLVLS